ncbi:methyltransferase domain-containing protein [Candidatus Pacearchaeota archaeon]|nr:methyltransferase domain-containing protein [Candidatus Pacearchaeota archaeon]
MVKVKELTKKYLGDLKVDSVLDLGCGKGFKSLRFAKKGIQVIGIDKKDFEIKQKCFEFKQEDISKFEFEKKYDLIITSLVLHFFNKEKAIELIKKIQSNTNDKGYNFLICMSNKDDCSKDRFKNFYPDLDLIKKIYSDWKIVKVNQGFTDYEEHDNLEKHGHNLIIVLVQK